MNVLLVSEVAAVVVVSGKICNDGSFVVPETLENFLGVPGEAAYVRGLSVNWQMSAHDGANVVGAALVELVAKPRELFGPQ